MTVSRYFALALCISLVMVAGAFAQADSSRIILKSGLEMTVAIKTVEVWGLTLYDAQNVLFKSLSKLETRDKELAQKILAVTANVETKNEGFLILLDFEHAKFQNVEKPRGIVHSATLNYSIDYCSELAFQVNAIPTKYENLLFSAGFSLGSTMSGGNQMYGIYGGAGFVTDFDKTSLLFSLNFSTRVIQPELFPSEDRNSLFLKAEAQSKVTENGKIVVLVGAYVFFEKTGYGTKETWGGLRLGIGMTFLQPDNQQ